ncbi:MAG: twin-arginine translocase subunit TatC [Bacillota bacterium]|jgi:sec-independent protein translocase protein TatC|nr:twin-arginine translocase subunit TatC [Bacillota bacterium]
MPESVSQEKDQEAMPLLKHLEELRKVIIVSLVAIGVASIGALFFVDQILAILTKPVRDLGHAIVFTAMTEGIFTKFKVALLAGAVFASPVVLWQFWRFFVPALYPHEKKYVLRLVPVSILLFAGGVVFAYFAVFPLAVFFLIKLAGGFEPMLTISRYFSFTLTFLIPFGLIFEFPLIIYFLSLIGVVTPEWLVRNRKYSIVSTFILAAILTPGPDPLSQSIMAAPMLIFYEIGILVAKVVARKKRARFNELASEEGTI